MVTENMRLKPSEKVYQINKTTTHKTRTQTKLSQVKTKGMSGLLKRAEGNPNTPREPRKANTKRAHLRGERKGGSKRGTSESVRSNREARKEKHFFGK